MMEPEETDIQRLIRLKRYELPPEGFVDDFVRDFQYRQRSELLKQSSFSIFWDRLTAFMDGRSTQVAGVAFATVALLGLGGMALVAPHGKTEAPAVAAKRSNTGTLSPVSLGGIAPAPPAPLYPPSNDPQDPITVTANETDFVAIPLIGLEDQADVAKHVQDAELGNILLSDHFRGGLTLDNRKEPDRYQTLIGSSQMEFVTFPRLTPLLPVSEKR